MFIKKNLFPKPYNDDNNNRRSDVALSVNKIDTTREEEKEKPKSRSKM